MVGDAQNQTELTLSSVVWGWGKGPALIPSPACPGVPGTPQCAERLAQEVCPAWNSQHGRDGFSEEWVDGFFLLLVRNSVYSSP